MALFQIGVLVGWCSLLAGVWAIGAARIGTFLLALADALEAAKSPAADPVEVRAEVVAAVVKIGYSVNEAEEAVSDTASTGPRRYGAWRTRAIRRARLAV